MGKHTSAPPPPIAERIAAAYAAGCTVQQARQGLGVSQYWAKKCILEAGLNLRSQSETNRRRRPSIAPDALREVLNEARSSHLEMAAHFGVSAATLSREMRILGLCSVKGRGSPMEKNYFWNGGRMVDADGYVLLKVPDHPNANNNGYVREHRLVMERELGRYLFPWEAVHHKDEDPSNNDPSNLEVYGSNGDHIRDHMLEGSIPRCPMTGRLVKKPTSRSRLRRTGQRKENPTPSL